jgi:uncharacterized protein (TIGR02118 family)
VDLVPWFRSSRRVAVRGGVESGGPGTYFGVAEAEFDDPEALSAAIASPEGQAVLADIPNYATGRFVILNYLAQEVQLR